MLLYALFGLIVVKIKLRPSSIDADIQKDHKKIEIYQRAVDKLDSYLKNDCYCVFMLPEDLMRIHTIDKMIEFVVKGRATTWKECVYCWEEYVHRCNLENTAEETRAFAQEAAARSRSAESAANIAMWNSFWNSR